MYKLGLGGGPMVRPSLGPASDSSAVRAKRKPKFWGRADLLAPNPRGWTLGERVHATPLAPFGGTKGRPASPPAIVAGEDSDSPTSHEKPTH